MDHSSPFLLIINGPPGTGKTSLSERFHRDFPMSYLAPVTKIRDNFSNFENNRSLTYKNSIAVIQSIADKILALGSTIIIEGVFWDNQEIDVFSKIAKDNGVPFYHIVLTAPLETALKRADARGYPKESVGGLNREKVISFYESFEESKPAFENTIPISTEDKNAEEVYLAALSFIK